MDFPPLSTKVIFAAGDREGAVQEAAQILREGGIVVVPTETVYGLAANALDGEAVAKIFKAKGRPQDNPLIVHIADASMLAGVAVVTSCGEKLMRAYWPGPISLVMHKGEQIPDIVTAGLSTVAVRMPEDVLVREIIRAAGVPVAAPSANLSGKPSPTNARHAFEDMGGRVPLIIDGGPCGVGVESTVVDVTGDVPVVLRPGAVTVEMITDVCGEARLHSGAAAGTPASPGMKYRHYAPDARVYVYHGDKKEVAKSIRYMYNLCKEKSVEAVVFCVDSCAGMYAGLPTITLGGDAAQVSAALFASLREADEAGYGAILFHYVEEMGLAVKNRIAKAAENKATAE